MQMHIEDDFLDLLDFLCLLLGLDSRSCSLEFGSGCRHCHEGGQGYEYYSFHCYMV